MPKSTFMIPSMDCPAEEAVIRNRLKSVKGVDGLHFDLFNRRLTVSHTHSDDVAIVAVLKSVGMEPRSGSVKSGQSDGGHESAYVDQAKPVSWWRGPRAIRASPAGPMSDLDQNK